MTTRVAFQRFEQHATRHASCDTCLDDVHRAKVAENAPTRMRKCPVSVIRNVGGALEMAERIKNLRPTLREFCLLRAWPRHFEEIVQSTAPRDISSTAAAWRVPSPDNGDLLSHLVESFGWTTSEAIRQPCEVEQRQPNITPRPSWSVHCSTAA